MEILPHIHLVEGVRGANSYLIESDSNLTLVDTGLPGNGSRIARYIARLNRKPEELTFIILTHADVDHSGSTAELVEQSPVVKVAIHKEDSLRLAGKMKLKEAHNFFGPIIDFATKLSHFRPITPDIELEDGDVTTGLRVIHTPGHTQGHICLLGFGDVLFAGDALRVSTRGRLRETPGIVAADKKEAYRSLQALKSVPFNAVLPGHGKPITHGAKQGFVDLLRELGISEA